MRIYLDHNATTPPDPRVLAAMSQVLDAGQGAWGNPSSLHEEGRKARHQVETARKQVAQLLGASPMEIVFTSGGTEANHLALSLALGGMPTASVVLGPLEHPSVGLAAQRLCAQSQVRLLGVSPRGEIDLASLQEALLGPEKPGLVSLQLANHEIGTLNPIADVAALCKRAQVPLHCDGVQAVGRIPVLVTELGVDLLSLSGHKFNGPKGVGALYIRRGAPLPSGNVGLLPGGQQERGRRAGTENVPGIVGLGVAASLAAAEIPLRSAHVASLRTHLEERLLAIPGTRLHGDPDPAKRTPGTCNIGFAGIEGDILLMRLDLAGVAVSTTAACSSGSTEPSPVLLALGLTRQEALSAVRFSLGPQNTQGEIDRVIDLVASMVSELRALPRT